MFTHVCAYVRVTADEFDKNLRPAQTQGPSRSPVDIALHASRHSAPHLPARAMDLLTGDQQDGYSPAKRSRNDAQEFNERWINQLIHKKQQEQQKKARAKRAKTDACAVAASR